MFSLSLSYEESCGSFVHNSISCCIYLQLSNIVSSESYLTSTSIESSYKTPLACIEKGKIQQICGAAEHLLQKTNLARFRSVKILLLMSQVLIMTTLKLSLCRQSNWGEAASVTLFSIQSRIACNPCCTGRDSGQFTEFLAQHGQVRGKDGCYHHELSFEVVQGCLCLGIIAKSLFDSS